jgi:hypothetical protein
MPELAPIEGASEEEYRVARVLAAFQQALPAESQDLIALATAFRDPPTESSLLHYLASAPVQGLLHETWRRGYQPFVGRPSGWLASQLQELIDLRLLERVGRGEPGETPVDTFIDAHPLVRRAFEHVLGPTGRRQNAQARAGFLHGRPDRVRPATLEQARQEVELFHAYCDACLWEEADASLADLDNPKHRLLAPALERDLHLRFFPGNDWQKPPLWARYGRYRSLAICFEMLGQFDNALGAYRETDGPLRGDALLALGQLKPLVDQPHGPHPWQALWSAYRCHALCLAGRTSEAVALAMSLVPVDIYEWVHVFECLLRAGQLAALDLRSVLFRPPHSMEHRWAALARRRMRADYLRTASPPSGELGVEYQEVLEAYDQGGMPYERALTRLGYAAWLFVHNQLAEADQVLGAALILAAHHRMPIVAADAWGLREVILRRQGLAEEAVTAADLASKSRKESGYLGPRRP